MRRPTITLSLAFVFQAAPAAAERPAGDAFEQASILYDAAARRMANGEYAGAAVLFAKADALAPSDVALRQALQASLLADDGPLAIALLDRADAAPAESAVARLGGQARARFSKAVGRIEVRCAGCSVEVDGAVPEPVRRGFVHAGRHVVSARRGDTSEQRAVAVEAEKTVVVDFPTRTVAVATAPKPEARRNLSPTWFWIGVGTSAVLAAATTVSFVDLVGRHADFEASPNPATQEDGRSAQTRTQLLGAGAAVAFAATIGIAFFTFGRDRTTARAGSSPSGVFVVGAF